MLDIDGRKRTLLLLIERIERLRAPVPEASRAFHSSAQRLRTDIEGCLARLVPMIKSETVRGFQERVGTLDALAAEVMAVRAQAGQLLSAEQALAGDIARVGDAELKDWFAARGRRRRDLFTAAGNHEVDTAALEETRNQLKSLNKNQQNDRAVLGMLGDAHRFLKTIRARERIQALADALPTLQRRLLLEGPKVDSITQLKDLIEPLRRFQNRDKPLEFTEVFGLMERLAEWVRQLEGGPLGPTQREAAARKKLAEHIGSLRNLSSRYNDLSEHWQDHEDGAFAAILDEFQTLEQGLLAQAQDVRTALVAELERNREMLRQLADPRSTPELAATIDLLLSQTPDTPDRFGEWRRQCGLARGRFEESIDADSHLIKPRCEVLHRVIRERIEQIEALPLDPADRAQCARILNALTTMNPALTADVPVPDLLASLESLDALAEQAKTLFESVLRKAQHLDRRRRGLSMWAERLQRLAADLGEPLPELIDPPVDTSTDLQSVDLKLDSYRRLLTGIQTALLQRGAARLGTRLAGLAVLQALLDEDLALADADLRRLRPVARRKDLEVLIVALPPLDTRVQAAVEIQITRLLEQRDTLLGALAGSNRNGLSGADCEELNDLIPALRECDRDHLADPRVLVPSLREWIAAGRRLLESIGGKHHDLDTVAQELNRRLASLRRDHQDDEIGDKTMVNRIWALIQPVVGVSISTEAREGQLQEAGNLVYALEAQVRRRVAHRFARDWDLVRHGDDPQTRDLVREIGDDPLIYPNKKQRQLVRDLARQHR
jgi:hypothetical protein